MNQANPHMVSRIDDQPKRGPSWPTLGDTSENEISSQTLQVALEDQYARNQNVYHQMVRLIQSFPMPAMLLNGQGEIISVNRRARMLMSEIHWTRGRVHIEKLWHTLGWPQVPFSHWNWEGGRLSVWDCALGIPGQSTSLSIRYFKNESVQQLVDEAQQKRLVAIGEKAGCLAHDIRNPLASIEWFATLVGRADHSNHEHQELTEHLIQASRSLNAMATNLLLFSHPMQPQWQDVNVRALLDDIELLTVHLLHNQKLSIHRHPQSGVQTIVVDEQLLKQALLNILLNAIQASEPGGCIEIQYWWESLVGTESAPPVEGIVLSIHDYGSGMSSEALSNMFQPFFSKRKGGIGLGLSIVKHIIDVHEGMIDVQSQKGKGTNVRLFLPQKRRMA